MIGVFVGFLCIPLNAELNPICHLLALLGGATIVVVSRLKVKCACCKHEMARPRLRMDETVSRHDEKGLLNKEDWQVTRGVHRTWGFTFAYKLIIEFKLLC